MSLGNVVTSKRDAGAGLSVPVAGITLGPSGSFSGERKAGSSLTVILASNISSAEGLGAVCKANAGGEREHPISDLIVALQKEFSETVEGGPAYSPKQLKISSSFNVTKTTNGKIKLNFLVIEAGAGGSLETKNSQSLLLDFDLTGSDELKNTEFPTPGI